MQTLRVGISPCPNDTFAFYALVHQALPQPAFKLEVTYADISELNTFALAGELDFVKISYFTYAKQPERFRLLESGSALGHGVGPLLVALKGKRPLLEGSRVALPGLSTTAHLLFHLYAPGTYHREEALFSAIPQAVADGLYDYGVIIHESRFTYQDYGLELVQDLGQYWEEAFGVPIPLGGIIAQPHVPAETVQAFEQQLAKSIRYAWAHEEEAMPYVRQYAQEMQDDVMRQHIGLYVNAYSEALGPAGHEAIQRLTTEAYSLSKYLKLLERR